MSNKQLSVGKLKNKTREEFYPKTVWEAILAAPDNGCICAEVIYYPQHVYIK